MISPPNHGPNRNPNNPYRIHICGIPAPFSFFFTAEIRTGPWFADENLVRDEEPELCLVTTLPGRTIVQESVTLEVRQQPAFPLNGTGERVHLDRVGHEEQALFPDTFLFTARIGERDRTHFHTGILVVILQWYFHRACACAGRWSMCARTPVTLMDP